MWEKYCSGHYFVLLYFLLSPALLPKSNVLLMPIVLPLAAAMLLKQSMKIMLPAAMEFSAPWNAGRERLIAGRAALNVSIMNVQYY